MTETILDKKPHLISNGFKKAGVFPWDPTAVATKRMEPSNIYEPLPEVSEEQLEIPSNTSTTETDDMVPNLPGIGISPSTDVSMNQVEDSIMTPIIVEEPLIGHNDSNLVDNIGLPKFTPRFLQKYELLLSDSEVKKFEELIAAKKFDVDNPPYQAWLVLKNASLPIAEREAVQQVLQLKYIVWLIYL